MSESWVGACPVCGEPLGALGGDRTDAACRSCATTWVRTDGIWRMLHPARAPQVDAFLADYLPIRHAEGRDHDDADWYRALPSTSATDPLHEQWRMRAVSWRHVDATVLTPMSRRLGRPLHVADLGAGVGWLSHQVRRRGHRPISLDVNVDPHDGLGAARHLEPDWPVVQAHYDHLPFQDAGVDVALFDASLHYATDPVATLTEARRVTGPDGLVVVLDSPIYRRERDGEAMLAERAADFERRFGTRSDSLPSIGFLTPGRLDQWGRAVGIGWTVSTPWYGWRWAVRPWTARARRRRAPSRFRVVVGRPLDARLSRAGARARS